MAGSVICVPVSRLKNGPLRFRVFAEILPGELEYVGFPAFAVRFRARRPVFSCAE